MELDAREVRAGEELDWTRLVVWLRERLPACGVPGLDVGREPGIGHGCNPPPCRKSPRGVDVGSSTTVDPRTPIASPEAIAGASCNASKLTSDDW